MTHSFFWMKYDRVGAIFQRQENISHVTRGRGQPGPVFVCDFIKHQFNKCNNRVDRPIACPRQCGQLTMKCGHECGGIQPSTHSPEVGRLAAVTIADCNSRHGNIICSPTDGLGRLHRYLTWILNGRHTTSPTRFYGRRQRRL